MVYLAQAPVAIEGQGGDAATFKVAAALKDLGCDEATAFDLMAAHWNEKCEPPWSLSDLRTKVHNAYRYGREPAGSRAPEAVFSKVETKDEEGAPGHPVERLNLEYAFIKAGAFILHETVDVRGRHEILHLSPPELHSWFANKTMTVGKKTAPISKFWMEDPKRREYDRVVFRPAQTVPSRFYNLWRGFTFEPADTADHPSVAAFREHLFQNVCQRNDEQARWLTGYFAHLVQRPWEKPLTALVFKGEKGVGKNACVERVGALIGHHFLVADSDRYLLSNFNSHLENNLFFVLDEASWAGDKRAESRLKGLITGDEHVIERKGLEPYRVDNLTRVAILGNEEWLVPASVEERRFAVFEVGNGRRQDRKFFEDMRKGMEAGGYANLLRFLLEYDISGLDVNSAPESAALVNQKLESLKPIHRWWFGCLAANELLGGSYDGPLPEKISTNRLSEAFFAWAQQRRITGWLPDHDEIIRKVRKAAPSYSKDRKTGAKDETTYVMTNPGIDTLRRDWEKFIGGPCNWSEHG